MLVGLACLAQINAHAQSDWDCDKTDANWNCAGKETKQKQKQDQETNYEEDIQAINQEEASTNPTTTALEENDYSGTETQLPPQPQPQIDNNEDLEPLARPSKFPADANSIQLLASGSKDKIIDLIKQYRIPSLIIEYTTADQTLYLWIAGTYYSNVDAQIEIDRLPALPPNITPWVRPAKTIADMPVLVRATL
jgi:septal ring-binding cell division protein DamX